MSMLEKVRSTLGSYGEADVRSLLHADHERIRDLAKTLAEGESRPQRQAALRDLKPFLAAHSRSEEATVYARLMALRNSPDSRAAGNEGMVEHNVVDILMERLAASTDSGSDLWKAHATVVHELLEHHIKEEENDIFEELGEHFSEEEREAMGAEFVAKRDKLLTQRTKTPAARRSKTASAAA